MTRCQRRTVIMLFQHLLDVWFVSHESQSELAEMNHTQGKDSNFYPFTFRHTKGSMQNTALNSKTVHISGKRVVPVSFQMTREEGNMTVSLSKHQKRGPQTCATYRSVTPAEAAEDGATPEQQERNENVAQASSSQLTIRTPLWAPLAPWDLWLLEQAATTQLTCTTKWKTECVLGCGL